MRTQLRIVAGSLKGRKLTCTVNANLRPTPQMVREALFSILGDAVPGRPFFDVFAGTGVVGLESLSRGASSVTFVERDFRLIAELERHIAAFGVGASARIARADVYRWVERFGPPAEPVVAFLSPPFADFERRLDGLLGLVGELQKKIRPGSVVVLQAERGVPLDDLPDPDGWDRRTYGRNELFLWVKEPTPDDSPLAPGGEGSGMRGMARRMHPMTTPTEREFAIDVVRRLREAGHEALWAGGCVRDELLGLTPKDYDVATSALPEQVRRLFRRTVGVGEAFLVVEILGQRTEAGPLRVQAATFRSDGQYIDGRRPEGVKPSTAREDALRRDFTINGMFFDPLENRVIDYVGGQEDLKNRVLRAIGDPESRIGEDKLRMMRAARMAARFELTIDPATAAAIRKMAPGVMVVSAERIADEFRKMLVDRHRARAMRLFVDLGLAEPVLPELLPMRGLPQGLPRPDGPALPAPGRPAPSPPTPLPRGERGGGEGMALDLWEHVLRVLDLLGEAPSFPLAFAALLHDVGKPRTVGRTPDRYTFYCHEHVGRRLASEICLRLKTSNEERERVEWLVEKHQILADARQMKTSKLKTLLAHPGIHELLALDRADALASGRSDEHVGYCERLLREWSEADLLDPPPLFTGHDLQRMGLEPGPIYKRLLDAVREAQLDGTIRTTAEARLLVERLLEVEKLREP